MFKLNAGLHKGIVIVCATSLAGFLGFFIYDIASKGDWSVDGVDDGGRAFEGWILTATAFDSQDAALRYIAWKDFSGSIEL